MAENIQYTGNPNAHDVSEFEDGMTGITVIIKDGELFTKRRGHLCHCSNCRKVSGSYVAANFVIENSSVEVIDKKGTLKKYEDGDTGSGKPIWRSFCGNCGSSIMSVREPVGESDIIILKMGMFPRIPAPEAEAFAAHRHEWQGKHEGVVQFATMRGGKKLGK